MTCNTATSSFFADSEEMKANACLRENFLRLISKLGGKKVNCYFNIIVQKYLIF